MTRNIDFTMISGHFLSFHIFYFVNLWVHDFTVVEWLNWLTTSDYGKKWIPEKIKQMSPIKGAESPDSQLAKETSALLSAGTPSYPWFYQRFPNGAEQGLGTILQEYCAGSKTREQTLASLDEYYQKLIKDKQ